MDRTEEMKEMIQREIQNIRKLEERAAFRELMEGVFLPLYETNQRMYEDLEDRIQEELSCDVNRCLIRTVWWKRIRGCVASSDGAEWKTVIWRSRATVWKSCRRRLQKKEAFPL